MKLFVNHFQNARQSIRANQMRSFLTMLGITIGIASITAIFALGAGAQHIVSDQVDELGGNIAVVRPGNQEGGIHGEIAQLGSSSYATSTLTDVDVTTIGNIKHVTAVAPIMILPGAVKGNSDAPKNTPIVATSPDFAKMSSLKISEGQFLDDELVANAVVIGTQLSIDSFGTEHSIGKTLKIRGESHTVVGVIARLNQPINYNGVDIDRSAIVSMRGGRDLNQGALHIQQINIQSDSIANLDTVITDINKSLLRSHYQQADFTVLAGPDIAQPTSRLFSAIAGFSITIAAISLIVGGVGIMNIMLVNVAERTREIGIRKALGATNSAITTQFLIESVVLSLSGGLAGYLLGYGTAFIVSIFLTFDPIFTWQIAVLALGLSLVIGTLFGLYPALKASRKDPITALRQYE